MTFVVAERSVVMTHGFHQHIKTEFDTGRNYNRWFKWFHVHNICSGIWKYDTVILILSSSFLCICFLKEINIDLVYIQYIIGEKNQSVDRHIYGSYWHIPDWNWRKIHFLQNIKLFIVHKLYAIYYFIEVNEWQIKMNHFAFISCIVWPQNCIPRNF